MLAKAIRFWIPEITFQAQATKDRAHLVRLRTPRILLQSGRIPGRCERPELVNPYEWPHRVSVLLAPLSNSLFRPEEEHVASGEDNVIPPLRRRNEAVAK